ncbi:MAG: FliM/FliN family flagellar motor switch protein [Acidobacteriota bacterium]
MSAATTRPFSIDWDLDVDGDLAIPSVGQLTGVQPAPSAPSVAGDGETGGAEASESLPRRFPNDGITIAEATDGGWIRAAPRYLAPDQAAVLPSWSDGLATADETTDAGPRAEIRTLLESLPPGLPDHLAAAVRVVSGLQPSPGAVFGVLSRSGRRHRFEMRGEVLRLGRGETCHLRLDDHELPDEVAEVRVADAGPWLVPVDSSVPVLVRGDRVHPHRYARLEVGAEVQIAGHRLVLEDWCRAPRGAGVAVHPGEIQVLDADDDPFAAFGDDALWAEVSLHRQRFFVHVPETWTALAYEALGEPAVPLAPMDQVIDRALTRAMLRAVAHEVAARTDRSVELLRFGPAGSLKPRETIGWCRWHGELEVHGRSLPTAALWPRPTTGRRLLDPGRLRFTASILAGSVALERSVLDVLETGDIVVPDHWWSDSGPAPDGPVLVTVQQFCRRAQLEVSDQRVRLKLHAAEWSAQPQGDVPVMPSSRPVHDESTIHQAPTLDKGLEVALSFELDRLSVSLNELGSWRAGAAVTLQRAPTDAVRVLLHHAGGQRLVGRGTVVRVDDQLGVRLDEWYPGAAS